jgi:hypothetical protein
LPNASDEVIKFAMNFGDKYGYTFEHEATYDRLCLINDAVYVAREGSSNTPHYNENGEYDGPWTSTGTQFIEPYVFKTLFSGESIKFEDLCQTKSVKTAMYLDMNEELGEDEHNYIFVGKAGLFCPMKPGTGGGVLTAIRGDKYNAVTGSKGYRWMESAMVKELGKEDDIDLTYFETLAQEAKDEIWQYCDFDWFVSEKPYDIHDNAIIPF